MDKVRIGIIGMGRMGITHYSIINTHPSVEIVSVSDTSELILKMLKKYTPNLKTYTDYKDLLVTKDIDGIIVCTPSFLHHPICKMACENGISVFCEKPFTTDPKLANELADMFEAKGLINQVGYVNRFDPVWNKVKEYLQKGVIGKVAHVNAQFFSATITAPQKKDGWRSKRENGGGATYEMGAHIIDLMEFFFGKPEKLYGSVLDYIYDEKVEDICSAEIAYSGGTNVSLHVDWSDFTYRKPMMKVEMMGDKGKILADFYGYKIFLRDENKEEELPKGWTTVPMNMIPVKADYYVRGVGYTNQLYTFADAIKDGKKVVGCSFREAADTQGLIHEIFENDKR